MVESPANADGQIDRRGDGAPADADLQLLRQPAGVHHIAGSGDRGVQRAGQFPQRRHIFGAGAHPQPQHDAGAGQFQPLVILLKFLPYQPHISAAERRIGRAFQHHRGGGIGRGRGQQAGPQRHQIGQRLGEDGRHHIAPQCRFELHQPPIVVDFQIDGVPGQPQLQPGGQPGGQIAPVSGGGEQHGVGEFPFYRRRQCQRRRPAAWRPQRRIVQRQHPVGAALCQGGGIVGGVGVDGDGGDFALGDGGQFPRLAQHFVSNLRQTAAGGFGYYPYAAFPAAGVAGLGGGGFRPAACGPVA